ncbi:MAG: Tripartite tricarboxylate transporter substrate binding protein [Clostridium sp.]|jgi:tripartite-type tricarboxylate transporter receptor subunit TctC
MKNLKKLLSVGLALALSAALLTGCNGSGSESSAADSQPEESATIDFPTKQINVIVPYSAGGASDTVARIYASQLQSVIGKPVIVTNKTGASGSVGLEYVRNSNPDGYTIAYMPVESTMLKALGFTDLSTDDFKFIGRAMTIPAAITVRSDSKWNTLEEFIEYAKENPGEIKVGNSGTGSIWHIAAASLEQKTGCQFTHVPFDGAAPAVAALLGRNIDATAVSPSEVQSSVDSGELKILAVIGDERSSIYPDIPTAQELGIDVSVQGWGGFAVPKDTPQEIIDILETASEQAINSDEMKQLLSTKGYNFAYLSGSEMDEEAKQELDYFSELIPQLGIVEE